MAASTLFRFPDKIINLANILQIERHAKAPNLFKAWHVIGDKMICTCLTEDEFKQLHRSTV